MKETESTNEFDFYADIVEEINTSVGPAMASGGIRVLIYLDTEGKAGFTWRIAGTESLASVIGILEMVKADLIETFMYDWGGDEDEGDDADEGN